MALWSFLDLTRLTLALLGLTLVLPGLALLAGRSRSRWPDHLGSAFIRSTFFLLCATLVLGDWRLCLPGAMASLYLLFLAATAAFAARTFWLLDAIPGSEALLPVLEWMEGAEPAAVGAARRLWRRATGSPMAAIFALLVLAAFLQSARLPIHSFRFQTQDAYGRALALQQLTHGESWDRDTSAAWLAPLVHAAGVDAATAIRLSGPLVLGLLLLAASWLAWRFTKDLAAAYLTAGLLAMFFLARGLDKLAEPSGADIAAIWWVLALSAWTVSRGDSIVAALSAMLISREQPLLALPVILATGFALGAARLLRYPLVPNPLRHALTVAPVLGLLYFAMATPRTAPEHGAQYEGAARVAYRIAREFRHNDWILVSPGQEVPLIYGRGWHVELADFVTRFPETAVADPKFRFPYEAANLFVVLERKPLAQPSFQLAQDSHAAAYFYNTRMGRVSLEFQAARLMAVYSRTHMDAAVFYEDEDLTVYRIPRDRR